MKRIYIAGPISKGDLVANINQATAAFLELLRAGLCPFCPHWSVYAKPAEWTCALEPDALASKAVCVATVDGSRGVSHAEWLRVDLAWVAVSDAVLRLPGESTGADAEVAHALEHCIPVFESVADVVAWANVTRPQT